MRSFNDLRNGHLKEEYLEEKAIVVGNGARYGQIIFLAGGAGSGKGFTVTNFLEGDKFKVRDVDEWKRIVLKINSIKRENEELLNLDLRNPDHVFKLHKHVEGMGLKDKTLLGLLQGMTEGRLPNIIFDVTLKKESAITNVLPSLLAAGYKPEDINLVWVLTDYSVAVKQNKTRSRVVPDDILLQTHEGAANTMIRMIEKGMPNGMDGSLHVVLGGKKHTVFYTDEKGKPLKTSRGKYVIKSFDYITVKKAGKRMLDSVRSGPGGTIAGDVLKKKLYDAIMQKIPKGKTLSQMMGSKDG